MICPWALRIGSGAVRGPRGPFPLSLSLSLFAACLVYVHQSLLARSYEIFLGLARIAVRRPIIRNPC